MPLIVKAKGSRGEESYREKPGFKRFERARDHRWLTAEVEAVAGLADKEEGKKGAAWESVEKFEENREKKN